MFAARFNPPRKTRRTEIGHQFAQVDVGRRIEPVSGLIVGGFCRTLEPAGHAYPIAKRRQFQQRQIKPPAVKTYKRRPVIFFPPTPKVFRNDVRPKLRLVQHHNVFQAVLGRYLARSHRDGQLEAIGNEVAPVFRHQFVTIASHGLVGRKSFGRITQLRH